jgi:hypothetical protein
MGVRGNGLNLSTGRPLTPGPSPPQSRGRGEKSASAGRGEYISNPAEKPVAYPTGGLAAGHCRTAVEPFNFLP